MAGRIVRAGMKNTKYQANDSHDRPLGIPRIREKALDLMEQADEAQGRDRQELDAIGKGRWTDPLARTGSQIHER